jgi:hypothetical protein
MKMVKSLLLGSAAGLVAVAGAQAADLPVKAKPVEYVKICTLYGDGFYYIPGTETCVRIGASAQADYYYHTLANGHMLFDGAGGAHDRTTSEHAMRGRGDVGLDSRAQTAYGTLRSVIVLRMDNGDGGTVTPNVPRAFIQWAGFTFGHTRSYSDPTAGFGGGDGFRSILQGITHADSGANGTNQIAYTWELGNGMVIVVGADERKNNSMVNLSNASQVTVGVAPVTSRAGMLFPDPYLAFRMSQTWGSFTTAIKTEQNSALYYTGGVGCPAGAQAGTTQCLHPSDKMGWAVLTGIQVNLPWIAQGDRIGGYFNFGEGATKFAGGQNLNSPGLFAAGNNLAMGVVTDGVYVNGGGIQLTTGWAFGAAFEHWITPQFSTTIYGSHAEIKYNSTVIASRLFCGGGGAVAQTFTVGAGVVCDPGFKYSEVRWQVSWYPVPAFRLAAEVGHAFIDTAFSGQQVTLAKTQGARPTGAYTAKDQGITAINFRAQRGFGGIGE